MNFCGIVCEFNPFHNGHEHIIKEAKRLSGQDVICLMSGDFVQRGAPAIESKYERAKKAIIAGANAVLELPSIYATSNAENFATGAIKIFKALGITQIAFGIENTNIETLQKVAKLKFENSERFKQAFKNEIQNGINYNTALKRSIAQTLDDENIADVLNKPNNILAIEYLTAILNLNANIKPLAIPRIDNGYNETTHSVGKFLSATGIRKLIIENKDYKTFVPSYGLVTKPFNNENENVYEKLCILNLRIKSASDLEQCYDYTEGIEFRIKKVADNNSSLAEILNHVATPRYRVARVNKLLLYPLLGITKNIQKMSETTKPTVKVLAIQNNKKDLLISHNKTKISLVVTNADYNSLNKKQEQIINIDLTASNIYNTIIGEINNNDKKKGTMFL